MFTPAYTQVHTGWPAFDLSPFLGLLQGVSLLKLVQLGWIFCRWKSSRSDREWNASDLSHCIYANNRSLLVQFKLRYSWSAQVELNACTKCSASSAQEPPPSPSSKECQFLPAFTPSFSLQRQGRPFISGICNTVESAC